LNTKDVFVEELGKVRVLVDVAEHVVISQAVDRANSWITDWALELGRVLTYALVPSVENCNPFVVY
jgi:hypothetical protein